MHDTVHRSAQAFSRPSDVRASAQHNWRTSAPGTRSSGRRRTIRPSPASSGRRCTRRRTARARTGTVASARGSASATDQRIKLELGAIARDGIGDGAGPGVAAALGLEDAGLAGEAELGPETVLDRGDVRAEAVLELDVEQAEDGRRIRRVVRTGDDTAVAESDLAFVDKAEELRRSACALRH